MVFEQIFIHSTHKTIIYYEHTLYRKENDNKYYSWEKYKEMTNSIVRNYMIPGSYPPDTYFPVFIQFFQFI